MNLRESLFGKSSKTSGSPEAEHPVHRVPTPELIYHNFNLTDDEWSFNPEFGNGHSLPSRRLVFSFKEGENVHNLELFDLPTKIRRTGGGYEGVMYFDDKDLTRANSLMTLIDAEYKEETETLEQGIAA